MYSYWTIISLKRSGNVHMLETDLVAVAVECPGTTLVDGGGDTVVVVKMIVLSCGPSGQPSFEVFGGEAYVVVLVVVIVVYG